MNRCVTVHVELSRELSAQLRDSIVMPSLSLKSNKMTEQDNDLKPEDVITGEEDAITARLSDIEDRVNNLERLIMVIIDKLELDYPGISL
jgi:hypothetical protein